MSQLSAERNGQQEGNRLFVAIEIPEEIKNALTDLQRHIPDLKWTPPAHLHLTIRFIGLVPAATMKAVQESLRRIRHGAFRLTVAGLGLFPRRTGGILWAGVHEEPALRQLRRQVDEALCLQTELSLPDTPFSPHLTLCRLKKLASPTLKNLVKEKIGERFGEFPVTAFTLFRSHLRQSGAIHEAAERYALIPEDRSIGG
jgi:2'-5' RNA ligase